MSIEDQCRFLMISGVICALVAYLVFMSGDPAFAWVIASGGLVANLWGLFRWHAHQRTRRSGGLAKVEVVLSSASPAKTLEDSLVETWNKHVSEGSYVFVVRDDGKVRPATVPKESALFARGRTVVLVHWLAGGSAWVALGSCVPVVAILKQQLAALVPLTRGLTEHIEGYDGECYCESCMSYAAEYQDDKSEN